MLFLTTSSGTSTERIILVCGGRDYNSRWELYGVLDGLDIQKKVIGLIHGAARGADSLARDWMNEKIAFDRQRWVAGYPAQWDKWGKKAGPIRNQQMLDSNPGIELVVAFPGGTGTNDMVSRAEKAGIQVLRI